MAGDRSTNAQLTALAWTAITGAVALWAATTAPDTPACELHLDTSLQYHRNAKPGQDADRWGRVRTSERRVHVGYRLNADGLVTHTGNDVSERGPVEFQWTELGEPQRLNRDEHLRLCRVLSSKVRDNLVDITSMWGR